MIATWKRYQYYCIISVISFIALFFLPMIGSDAGLGWKLPDTPSGWIVYVTSKLLVAVVNILIFHCFILQGRANVRQDPRYIEALEILDALAEAHPAAPRSPEEWHRGVYGKKGGSIFVTSILSAFGLTQAVLTFDELAMLTYLFTIVMGVIFGILQMNEEEAYWTDEFLRYAKNTKEKHNDNS